jgi:glutaredoxin
MGEKQPIILYSSLECSRCQIVKRMLDIHNVQYEEQTDEQIMIEKELLEMPALEVDGRIIDEYSLVLNWLRENDYYSLGEV